jgi:hypothetical protein
LATAVREGLLEAIATDTPFFAENCLRIVDKRGRRVALVPNEPQLRFDATLEEQRAEGRPMRAIVLKARQLGISTWTQAKIIQRVTQNSDHHALTVAQDKTTAGQLIGIAELMYANLPADDELAIKPPLRNQRRQKEMLFGEPSVTARMEGRLGLNSSMKVDTAQELEAGRGFTYRSIHLSEVAFWVDIRRKMTALLNTVPDEPETLIVIESTANGHNEFKEWWDRAEAGESDYTPFFAAWHEDSTYTRPFSDQGEREAFIETIGEGPYGEDEPRLQTDYGCSPEQLHWRRWCIANRCDGDLRVFNQEFPYAPSVAFLSTGRQVFSSILVSQLIEETRQTNPKHMGALKVVRTATRRARNGTIDVPSGVKWEERPSQKHAWQVWEPPSEGKAFVVACDPAKGGEGDDQQGAYHAIQVINHKTLEQAAQWRSQVDPDLVAAELMKAALYWGKAWIAVETTGGYGLSIVRRLFRDYHYPRVYTRKSLDSRKEAQEDRLGWDTNRASKAILEDGAKELLREGTHGIRSHALAKEMSYYVQDARGRTGPEAGKHSDLLMAWMIAQQIAREKPVKPENRGTVSTTVKQYRNPRTGY